MLHVTTTTTGVSLDADGYSLCVDYATDWESNAGCATDEAVGVNGAVTLSLASGTHVVGLNGVAPNCTVSGDNPRTVDVGDTTDVSFVITCVATGTVHVTTATTGSDVPCKAMRSASTSRGTAVPDSSRLTRTVRSPSPT